MLRRQFLTTTLQSSSALVVAGAAGTFNATAHAAAGAGQDEVSDEEYAFYQMLADGWSEMESQGVSENNLSSVGVVLAVSARMGISYNPGGLPPAYQGASLRQGDPLDQLLPEEEIVLPPELMVRASPELVKLNAVQRLILLRDAHRRLRFARRARAKRSPALFKIPGNVGDAQIFLACDPNNLRRACEGTQRAVDQINQVLMAMAISAGAYASASASLRLMGGGVAQFASPMQAAAAILTMLLTTMSLARAQAMAARDYECGRRCA
jgi:hypothetical protein